MANKEAKSMYWPEIMLVTVLSESRQGDSLVILLPRGYVPE